MLKIDHISSGYDKKQVLFDVSLEVNAGNVILLTGGNGSGKSTLLKCIFSLLPLWSGSIIFNGENLNGSKPSDLIKKGIVYIPQKDFYFENLTVVENLQISGNFMPENDLGKRITEVLEITGLHKYKQRKPFNLSGGERKILAFGMGLIHKPKLLLFDEPFAGVDAKYSKTISNLFTNEIITPENSVIIVEHRNDSNQLFTRKIELELGKIKNI